MGLGIVGSADAAIAWRGDKLRMSGMGASAGIASLPHETVGIGLLPDICASNKHDGRSAASECGAARDPTSKV
jgi:hypothetical protein